jgi:hypothetical protein
VHAIVNGDRCSMPEKQGARNHGYCREHWSSHRSLLG